MDDSNHQGYLYTYTAQPDGCAGNCTGYTLTAFPSTLGLTGSRAFFVDESGIIRHCNGEGPADAGDRPLYQLPLAC